MKAQDLTGAKLAQWVALALGYKIERDDGELIVYLPTGEPCSFGPHGWRPDLNWAHGGPIIEQKRIVVEPLHEIGEKPEWQCGVMGIYGCEGPEATYWINGNTVLVASMRALVANKYGYEDLPTPTIAPQ